MKKINEDSNFEMKGRYHVEVHEAITTFKNPFKKTASKVVIFLRRFFSWKILDTLAISLMRGKLKRSYDYDNLITTAGKTAYAAQASGDNTTDIGDNPYIAVGSNAAAPVVGNTTLGTEVARKLAGSTSFAAAVASIAVFFAATEATGTHREFGLFGDGNAATASASVDTGTLFSHVAANVAVGATETLTITFQLTFS